MQSGRRIVSFANQGGEVGVGKGDVGVGQGDVSTGQRDDTNTNTRRRHNHKTQSRKSRPSQR